MTRAQGKHREFSLNQSVATLSFFPDLEDYKPSFSKHSPLACCSVHEIQVFNHQN